MHQHLLKKFERESKAMKRLSMNNEELIWKLSRSDIGPLDQDDDDDGDGDRPAGTAREAAGGMFVSATLPRRAGGPSATGQRAMSRSYDSPRAMFGLSATSSRQRGAAGGVKSTSTPKHRHESTAQAQIQTVASSLPSTISDSAATKLRRSGTYDVVDDQ